MPEINQLPSVPNVTSGNLIPLWDGSYGVTKKASAQQFLDFVNNGVQIQGGELQISSVYNLVGTSNATMPFNTTPSPVVNWNAQGYTSNANVGSAFTVISQTGQIVASRDVKLARFDFALAISGAASGNVVSAKLGVYSPVSGLTWYSPSTASVVDGVGSAQATLNASGVIYNGNNPFGTIKAGEIISLYITSSVADTATLYNRELTIQTMDGR